MWLREDAPQNILLCLFFVCEKQKDFHVEVFSIKTGLE